MAAKKKSAGRRGKTGARTGAKKSARRGKRKSAGKSAKRTLISPRGDKRYVRRDTRGRIKESDDVGRSLSGDRRRKAKKKAPKGQKDRGD